MDTPHRIKARTRATPQKGMKRSTQKVTSLAANTTMAELEAEIKSLSEKIIVAKSCVWERLRNAYESRTETKFLDFVQKAMDFAYEQGVADGAGCSSVA